MEEKAKNICYICGKEKNGQYRRYPGIKKHFYCDSCFENEIKKAQKGSIIGFSVTLGPVLIGLIIDLILSSINGSEFGVIFVGTWVVTGLLITFTKYPSRIVDIITDGIFIESITPWEFKEEERDSFEGGTLKFTILIVLQLATCMLNLIYVAIKNLVIFINATLFRKKVNESVITITYIITYALPVLAVILAFLLLMD